MHSEHAMEMQIAALMVNNFIVLISELIMKWRINSIFLLKIVLRASFHLSFIYLFFSRFPTVIKTAILDTWVIGLSPALSTAFKI